MTAADQNNTSTESPSAFGEGLPGMGELLNRTWEVYKRRILSFFAVLLIGVVLTCLLAAVSGGLGYVISRYMPGYRNMIGAVMGIFVALGAVWCFMWTVTSLVVITADLNIGIKEAFIRCRPKIHSMFWLSTLTAFLITGGYCLVVIPGLIFQVWFFFAPFVLVSEDTRGMNALMKSREYVRGRWFQTAWRLLAVWLVTCVISLVPVIGPIAAVLAMPFSFIYSFILYNDLKTTRGTVPSQPAMMAKARVIATGFLGFLAVPAILFAFMGSMILFPLMTLKQIFAGGNVTTAFSGMQGKLGDRQAAESLRKALNDEETVGTMKSGGSWLDERPVAKNAALVLTKLSVPAQPAPAGEVKDTGDFAEFLEAFHGRRYQEALRLGKRVLADKPDHVETLTKMGILFYEQKKQRTAKKYFLRVLELDPANEEADQYLKY